MAKALAKLSNIVGQTFEILLYNEILFGHVAKHCLRSRLPQAMFLKTLETYFASMKQKMFSAQYFVMRPNGQTF